MRRCPPPPLASTRLCEAATRRWRAATYRTATLTLTKTGPGRGSVLSAEPGTDCQPNIDTCVASLDSDTTLTLTASPIYGSEFGAWTGCNANGRFCSVTMDTSK